MATINGKTVTASGVLHFQGNEVVQTGTVPDLTFRALPSAGADEVETQAVGSGFQFTADLLPGSVYNGRVTGDLGSTNYTICYVFSRLGEMGQGPFYEVRYSVRPS